MSKQKLRSHEDLSGYIESLDETYKSLQSSIRATPSFSADSQSIIEDLISQMIAAKRKALDVIKIAKKFHKVYLNVLEQANDLRHEKNTLEHEISELMVNIIAQNKEISAKESRIEIMSHESTEIEKDYRQLHQETQQLRKELAVFKRESNNKAHPAYRSSLIMKTAPDIEAYKALKDTIEDQKRELQRRSGEIEAYQYKVKELESAYTVEKNAAEKFKLLYASLKKENLNLIDQLDELSYEKSNQDEIIANLNNELIKEKNYSESLIKEYDNARRTSSVAFNSLSDELKDFIEEENQKDKENEENNVDEIENHMPKYKAKAPKIENLADLLEEGRESEEEVMPMRRNSRKPDFVRQNTLFVLTSPVVNYERKFNFPEIPSSKFGIYSQETFSIIQSKISAKATFDLSKNKKPPQIFTFDEDDENGQGATPIKNSNAFIIQKIDPVEIFPKKSDLSLFKAGSIIKQPTKQLSVSSSDCFTIINKQDKHLNIENMIPIIVNPIIVQKNECLSQVDSMQNKIDYQSCESITISPTKQYISLFQSGSSSFIINKRNTISATDKLNIISPYQKSFNLVCLSEKIEIIAIKKDIYSSNTQTQIKELSVDSMQSLNILPNKPNISFFKADPIIKQSTKQLSVSSGDCIAIQNRQDKKLNIENMASIIINPIIIQKNESISQTDSMLNKIDYENFESITINPTKQHISLFESGHSSFIVNKQSTISDTETLNIVNCSQKFLNFEFLSEAIEIKATKKDVYSSNTQTQIKEFSVDLTPSLNILPNKPIISFFKADSIIKRSTKQLSISSGDCIVIQNRQDKKLNIENMASIIINPKIVQKNESISQTVSIQDRINYESFESITISPTKQYISLFESGNSSFIINKHSTISVTDTLSIINPSKKFLNFECLPEKIEIIATKKDTYSLNTQTQIAELSVGLIEDLDILPNKPIISLFSSESIIVVSNKKLNIETTEFIGIKNKVDKILSFETLLQININPNIILQCDSISQTPSKLDGITEEHSEIINIIPTKQQISLIESGIFSFKIKSKNHISEISTLNISPVKAILDVECLSKIEVPALKKEISSFTTQTELKELSIDITDILEVSPIKPLISLFKSKNIAIESVKQLSTSPTEYSYINNKIETSFSLENLQQIMINPNVVQKCDFVCQTPSKLDKVITEYSEILSIMPIKQRISLYESGSLSFTVKNTNRISEISTVSINPIKKVFDFERSSEIEVTALKKETNSMTTQTKLKKLSTEVLTNSDIMPIKQQISLYESGFLSFEIKSKNQISGISTLSIAQIKKKLNIEHSSEIEVISLNNESNSLSTTVDLKEISTDTADILETQSVKDPISLFVPENIVIKSVKQLSISTSTCIDINNRIEKIFSFESLSQIMINPKTTLKCNSDSQTTSKLYGISENHEIINIMPIKQQLSLYESGSLSFTIKNTNNISEISTLSINPVKKIFDFEYSSEIEVLALKKQLNSLTTQTISKELSIDIANKLEIPAIKPLISLFIAKNFTIESKKQLSISDTAFINVNKKTKKEFSFENLSEITIHPNIIQKYDFNSQTPSKSDRITDEHSEIISIIPVKQQLSYYESGSLSFKITNINKISEISTINILSSYKRVLQFEHLSTTIDINASKKDINSSTTQTVLNENSVNTTETIKIFSIKSPISLFTTEKISIKSSRQLSILNTSYIDIKNKTEKILTIENPLQIKIIPEKILKNDSIIQTNLNLNILNHENSESISIQPIKQQLSFYASGDLSFNIKRVNEISEISTLTILNSRKRIFNLEYPSKIQVIGLAKDLSLSNTNSKLKDLSIDTTKNIEILPIKPILSLFTSDKIYVKQINHLTISTPNHLNIKNTIDKSLNERFLQKNLNSNVILESQCIQMLSIFPLSSRNNQPEKYQVESLLNLKSKQNNPDIQDSIRNERDPIKDFFILVFFI